MIDLNTLSHEQIAALWPQAATELAAFADHLARNNSQLTANQMRLAIQMANNYVQMLGAVAPALDTLASSGEYTSFLPRPENRTVSLGQIKSMIAMVQKLYEVFTAVMTAIEPLITPPPGPAPAPGSFIGGFQIPNQDKLT